MLQTYTGDIVRRDELVGSRSIRCRTYTNSGWDSTRTIVFAHGGGFSWGTLDDYNDICVNLAKFTHSRVVSVEYRLAPANPFPDGFNDLVEVLGELEAERRRTSSREHLIVAGDSAGACLAAGAAQKARALGIVLDGQLLIYPMLEFYDRTPSGFHELSRHFRPTFHDIKNAWDAYIPSGEIDLPQYAVPTRMKALKDLPPAFTLLAQNDPLRFEGAAYAARMLDAGTPSLICQIENVAHGFLNAKIEALSPALDAVQEISKWLASLARAVEAGPIGS